MLFAALLLLPAGAAALLRWARCPGWPVVGGVVAGIVLGPTIFGRVLPDRYEALLVGGVDQRLELRELLGRQGSDLLAAEQAGYDGEQLSRFRRDQEDVREAAERRWSEAQWADQQPLRLFAFGFVTLMLLGSAVFGVPRGDPHHGIAGALSIGAWSAALPGGVAFCAMRWLWDCSASQSALVAAAVAIGPWALTMIDREAADHAELGGARMVQTAGRMATWIAIALAWLAIWHQKGPLDSLWAAPLLAILVSWLIPPPKPQRGTAPPPASLALCRGGMLHLVVPAVAACVAAKIDLFADFTFWPIAVLLLLSGDGRWLGAFTGAMVLGGRDSLRTMRLVLGSMAAGPTQLAVTAVAIHTGSIPARFAMGLLFGAVLIEVTAPARRRMAQRLITTEAEIEAMED